MHEPAEKRCITFIDSTSLHRAAQAVTGASYPNYEPQKISKLLCEKNGWTLTSTRLYVMTPSIEQSEYWCGFWANKIAAHQRDGVDVNAFVNRPAPRQCPIFNQDGSIRETKMTRVYGHEEMVVTMAIDALRLYNDAEFDVALFVSRDPSLVPVAREIRRLATEDDAWIKIASATVYDHGTEGYRCIDNTDWLHISSNDYESCIDRRDHRMLRHPTHA